MSLGTIALILLILLLVGAFPGWGHGGWGMGYYPMGGIGVIFIVLLILVLTGRL